MMDGIPFAELETDRDAIAAFNRTHSARTLEALSDAVMAEDSQTIRAVLEDSDTIRSVTRRGAWIYRFHTSADNPRGLWQRLRDGDPITPQAHWQTVFDLDAFCRETDTDWHWRGVATLWSDPDRVLLHLSHQGSDQTRHLEWDTNAAAAVRNGFDLAPARSSAAWLDEDTVLLASAALPDGATRSGWPRRLVALRRGQALDAAEPVADAAHDDLNIYGYSFPLPDGTRGIAIGRSHAIGDGSKTLRIGSQDIALTTPRGTLAFHNATHYAYVAGDHGPDPTGSLILQRLDGSDRRVLFTPGPRQAVQDGFGLFQRDHLLWIETDTMVPTLRRLSLSDPDAQPETLPLPVAAQTIRIGHYDAEHDGTGPLTLHSTGFLTPPQVWLCDAAGNAPERLISLKPTFDTSGMEVRLHLAISDDGIEVPYHIVLPDDHAAMMGYLSVLQYGYGGFDVSLTPGYQTIAGPVWLARGGAYVLAHIRGGGEFGKGWHLAAKGANRPRAFEDFAAVARDLVQRGYSTPDRIGCQGGSNGGLLCGVMLTRYPDRFGAVNASVGVLDMLRFHLFPAGAAWIDEYGDPDRPEDAAWLRAYSPLHQVAGNPAYPPALIDTNDSDDRVDPSHSRRFAAALMAAGQPTWFYSRSGGHGGGGDTVRQARDMALQFAFFRTHLKL